MFDIFLQEKVMSALMLSFLGLSLFLRIFLGLLYHNLIRETDNMATTGNKMLKQCKLKFANCYQLSNGVANIPVFVDKFLNRLSFGHVSYTMLYHLSGQTMLLSVVFSGVGICKCIVGGRTLGDILPFYIVSFLGLYLYFSVSAVADIKGKKRMLKVNLVDYLENHLSPRIDVTRQDIEMLYGEEIFDGASGAAKTRGGIDGSGRRKKRSAGGDKKKKTVELMPISGRLTPEEKKDLLAVAERFSGRGGEDGQSREDRQNREERLNREGWQSRPGREAAEEKTDRSNASASDEELETLLREFLAL